MDTILVTGGAGFIGYHLSKRLLKDGYNVVGYDNMNDYYDPKLKEDRVRDLEESGQDYRFIKGDLADKDMVFHLFEEIKPAIVVNLAAQAGVRYSIDHPDSYIRIPTSTGFLLPGFVSLRFTDLLAGRIWLTSSLPIRFSTARRFRFIITEICFAISPM